MVVLFGVALWTHRSEDADNDITLEANVLETVSAKLSEGVYVMIRPSHQSMRIAVF